METNTLSSSGLQLIVLKIAEEAWPLNLKYDGGEWFYFGQMVPLEIVTLMFEASLLRYLTSKFSVVICRNNVSVACAANDLVTWETYSKASLLESLAAASESTDA
jgi:hypothetical protein